MKAKSLFFLFIIILIGCSKQYLKQSQYKAMPESVLVALDSAKTNRQELEKVIKYYSQNPSDSLKLKAAYFLIGNMGKHCYAKFKIVDTTDTEVDFDVLSYPDYKTMVAAWDSLEKKIGEIGFAIDTIIYDINTITFDYLKNNIDYAFKAWQKPWAKYFNFDEFCEYILPYRGSNEPLENWRTKLYDKYAWVEDSLKDPSDPVEAAILINSDIKKWYDFDPIFYRHPTDEGYSEMLKYKKGRCEDMTNLAIYSMRAQGVPVMSDYTPAWPNTGNNHAWNAVLDKNKKVIIFMGGLNNPRDYTLNNKKAKVYRKTFGIQKNSLAEIKPKWEKVPGWLASNTYIDVTNQYISTVNVDIRFSEPKPDSVNFAYIAVFNSGRWVAIHWGEIEKNHVIFTDMGKDIVYLPAFYKNDKLIPANYPFILTENGEKIFLIPDTTKTEKVNLYSTTKKKIVLTTEEIRLANLKDGAEYELFYWDKEWKSLGKQIAKGQNPLSFTIPKNALLWLVRADSHKEERIFTIDGNGNQVWW